MKELIESFGDIIISHRKVVERIDNKISEYKAEITFRDDSILDFSEIVVFDLNKRKYSYHWMNAKNELLIRWDNALHYKHISTFPHHKHIGTTNTIEESFDITLSDVLEYIQKALLNA